MLTLLTLDVSPFPRLPSLISVEKGLFVQAITQTICNAKLPHPVGMSHRILILFLFLFLSKSGILSMELNTLVIDWLPLQSSCLVRSNHQMKDTLSGDTWKMTSMFQSARGKLRRLCSFCHWEESKNPSHAKSYLSSRADRLL